MNIDNTLDPLKALPRDMLLSIVYGLMRDGSITYHELMDMHIRHLEELRRGASDKYDQLQGRVVDMWLGAKKNRDGNLKNIMHYLLDEGRIQETHENIDKR